LEQLVRNTHEDLKFYEGTTVSLEFSILQSSAFFTDERRLKSIVHNIMSNSVKYSDPNKENCQLQVKVNVTPETCTLVFTDNGKGISEDNQRRVFDMFYRGTTERSGSGLGLYIVKEMTERIGGAIQLQSELGSGTSLTLTLPNLTDPTAA
jgi:signal transduction histidine kinase